jgi:enterochelin esterase-like enzyme
MRPLRRLPPILLLLPLLTACTAAPPVARAPATPVPALASPTTVPPTAPPTATDSLAPPTAAPVPSATPFPTRPACLDAPAAVVTATLASARLRQPLDYRVVLPPCYAEDAPRRYPVLYLIHGQSYTDDQWERLGAAELLAAGVAAGTLPPFLIVMPRDRVWTQPSEDAFGAVLVEELIPLIDAAYRTQPDRAGRAIGGLSRGAGWAVHLGLFTDDTFGALGGHSLALFAEDAQRLRARLAALPPAALPRIYLDIGDRDRPPIMASAVWFEELLTAQSIPHEWYLFRGYHEEAYWRAHLPGYLAWYAAPWRAAP